VLGGGCGGHVALLGGCELVDDVGDLLACDVRLCGVVERVLVLRQDALGDHQTEHFTCVPVIDPVGESDVGNGNRVVFGCGPDRVQQFCGCNHFGSPSVGGGEAPATVSIPILAHRSRGHNPLLRCD